MPVDRTYEIFQWQLASLRGCGILAVARRTSVFVKYVLATTFALVAFAATAFNSEQWLAERSDDSDMVRLRVAYRDCVSKIEAPAENVSFPLETFPDGSVKSRLTAARAQMFPDTGYIWGEKIRVEQYKNPGATNVWANLAADNCIVDRKTKSGWVEGNATMVYGDSSVKGRGIYFSLPREFIKILSKCEIRTKGAKMDPRSLLK